MIFNTSYVLNPYLRSQIVGSEENPVRTVAVGSVITDYFTQGNFVGDATEAVFSVQSARGLEVRADTADVTITLHEVAMLIKAGEVFQGVFDTFSDFTVASEGDFRIWVKE